MKIKYTASITLPAQKLNWHLDLTKQIGNDIIPAMWWFLDLVDTWRELGFLTGHFFFIFVSEGMQTFLAFDNGKDDLKAGAVSSGGEKQTMI